jgi:hypothetical protein
MNTDGRPVNPTPIAHIATAAPTEANDQKPTRPQLSDLSRIISPSRYRDLINRPKHLTQKIDRLQDSKFELQVVRESTSVALRKCGPADENCLG